jgi:hypothetical protein
MSLLRLNSLAFGISKIHHSTNKHGPIQFTSNKFLRQLLAPSFQNLIAAAVLFG